MKTTRNTSREFAAMSRIKRAIEAQEISVPEGTRKYRTVGAAYWRVRRYAAALIAAGMTVNTVKQRVIGMWRELSPTFRYERGIMAIPTFAMTPRQLRAHHKRQAWRKTAAGRKLARAERAWYKYGRVRPYTIWED